MARRSAPPSSRCVANECRSACGCTPPWTSASRTQTRSRRRTSEVAEPAPGLRQEQRGLAGVARERRSAPVEVAGDRGERASPAGTMPRLGSLALHADLLGVVIDARRRPGSRAPRRAARTRTRARTSRGREPPAASTSGCGPAAPRPRRGFSTVGSVARTLGGRRRDPPGSARPARARAGSGRARGSRPACGPPSSRAAPRLTEAPRRSGAASRWSTVGGASPARPPSAANCSTSMPYARRVFSRRRAPPQVAVQQQQRSAPVLAGARPYPAWSWVGSSSIRRPVRSRR